MAQDAAERTINISFSTLLKVVAAVLALYFVYQVLDVLALVFVSIVLSVALDPSVDWLQRRKIPRSLAVLIIYFLLFVVVSLSIVLLVPPLAQQLSTLAQSLPSYYSKLVSAFSNIGGNSFHDEVSVTLQQALQQMGSNLARATSSIIATVAGIFGGIVQLVITMVMTYYLTVEENGMKRFLKSVTPDKNQVYVSGLLDRIQEKLGWWLRGQMFLMLIIGVLTYIGLKLLGMDYALVLALWAGLTELVPYVGPVLGAIPAIFLALSVSPMYALWILVLYVIIQQVENQIVVPVVMKRAVGLNPIVSIAVVMIGAKLGGIVGAIMSIPIATAAAVAVSDYFESRKTPAHVGLNEAGEQPRAQV